MNYQQHPPFYCMNFVSQSTYQQQQMGVHQYGWKEAPLVQSQETEQRHFNTMFCQCQRCIGQNISSFLKQQQQQVQVSQIQQKQITVFQPGVRGRPRKTFFARQYEIIADRSNKKCYCRHIVTLFKRFCKRGGYETKPTIVKEFIDLHSLSQDYSLKQLNQFLQNFDFFRKTFDEFLQVIDEMINEPKCKLNDSVKKIFLQRAHIWRKAINQLHEIPQW